MLRRVWLVPVLAAFLVVALPGRAQAADDNNANVRGAIAGRHAGYLVTSSITSLAVTGAATYLAFFPFQKQVMAPISGVALGIAGLTLNYLQAMAWGMTIEPGAALGRSSGWAGGITTILFGLAGGVTGGLLGSYLRGPEGVGFAEIPASAFGAIVGIFLGVGTAMPIAIALASGKIQEEQLAAPPAAEPAPAPAQSFDFHPAAERPEYARMAGDGTTTVAGWATAF